jgi:hypothetical protein
VQIQKKRGQFAVYGADMMLDEDLNLWLIEVNFSPGKCLFAYIACRLSPASKESSRRSPLEGVLSSSLLNLVLTISACFMSPHALVNVPVGLYFTSKVRTTITNKVVHEILDIEEEIMQTTEQGKDVRSLADLKTVKEFQPMVHQDLNKGTDLIDSK